MFSKRNLGWTLSVVLLIILIWLFFSYKDDILETENTSDYFYAQIDSLENRIEYLDSVNTIYVGIVEEKEGVISSIQKEKSNSQKSLSYLRRKINSLNEELKNSGLKPLSLDSIPLYWDQEFKNYKNEI